MSATIPAHTTSSFPRPHILYTLHVFRDGQITILNKRYSDFIVLNDAIGSRDITLPPKRILATTFIPSAWMDDALVEERKAGLAKYLSNILEIPQYKDHPALLDFLKPSTNEERNFNPEDAIPSTLSRKTALNLVKGLDGKDAKADDESDSGIAAAYYPDWVEWSNPPESIDYSKFDIIFFAFALPAADGSLDWGWESQSLLRRVVSSAQASGAGTRVVLSVGGWGGSRWFSTAVNNDWTRGIFVNSLVSAVHSFNLDGIDIDWEYPNSEGAGNERSPADAANLLKLFQELRTHLSPSKIISAAVPHLPWLGEDGRPLNDISEYAEVMTYINIMNYDVWGASENPGPNAPLSNRCGTSAQPQASAQAALDQWTSAGAPASKLLLGLPLYGYVSPSDQTTLSNSFAPTEGMSLIKKDGEKDFVNGAHPRKKEKGDDVKTTEGDTDLSQWFWQQIPFNTLVASGALVKEGDGYRSGGGFTRGWDECSATPYLYHSWRRTVVTYDDPQSITAKVALARDSGMGGCFTWSLDQDDGTTLHDAIRRGLGKY